MNLLTAFGLVAVTLMLVFYTLEHRSRWYTLGFAFACALGSIYGFLQGAWPFGLVEGIWSLVALRRFWTLPKLARNPAEYPSTDSMDKIRSNVQ